MRLIFMGTPDFAVPTLVELAARGHDIAAVYTRAPKPAGRGMDLPITPIEREARRLSLSVFTPSTLKDADAQMAFAAHKADAAVVVAYGLILPKPILDAVRLGCFNLHASLLPRWRGAAPINRAILAGDTETGVCVMKMDEGLDTGPVATCRREKISSGMTAGNLTIRLGDLGAELMVEALQALEHGELRFTPQATEGVTYAHKIDKAEARIDWSKPSSAIHNQIRGLSPAPGAWFEITRRGQPERVRVMHAMIGVGSG